MAHGVQQMACHLWLMKVTLPRLYCQLQGGLDETILRLYYIH